MDRNRASEQQWQGYTGGGSFGQKALIWMLRFVPLRLLYFLLFFIVPFYMIFANSKYRVIYQYFRQQLNFSPIKSFFKTYKNHFIFGQVVIDRFAVFAGKKDKFDVEIEGYEFFEKLINGNKGFVMVSSHIGNYELSGYLLKINNKRLNILMYSGETEIVSKNRANVLNANNINLIPVLSDMSHIFLANAALERGEALSSMADRFNGSSNRGHACRFMNSKANFPTSIFMVATIFDVEVLTVFTIKISSTKYKIFIKPLNLDSNENISKIEKTNQLVVSYAQKMEDILRTYPEQWFNFYDFWK